MNKLIWSAIASTCLQIFSISPIPLPSKLPNVSMQITPKLNTDSWTEKFEQKRKETEFLDDDTEKVLGHHKKWFILMGVIFIWMIYKSLKFSE